jgi:heat shock protein HslJ
MRGVTRLVLIATLAAGAVLGAGTVIGCGRQAQLDGTGWVLTAWSVSALSPADFQITASFADGQISGTSAVNQYGGPCIADADGHFSAGALMSTEMAGSEPAMRAEAAYIKLLQPARSYRLEGGRLTLMDADGGELLVFAPRG